MINQSRSWQVVVGHEDAFGFAEDAFGFAEDAFGFADPPPAAALPLRPQQPSEGGCPRLGRERGKGEGLEI